MRCLKLIHYSFLVGLYVQVYMKHFFWVIRHKQLDENQGENKKRKKKQIKTVFYLNKKQKIKNGFFHNTIHTTLLLDSPYTSHHYQTGPTPDVSQPSISLTPHSTSHSITTNVTLYVYGPHISQRWTSDTTSELPPKISSSSASKADHDPFGLFIFQHLVKALKTVIVMISYTEDFGSLDR